MPPAAIMLLAGVFIKICAIREMQSHFCLTLYELEMKIDECYPYIPINSKR
jgi:hypothetical protein